MLLLSQSAPDSYASAIESLCEIARHRNARQSSGHGSSSRKRLRNLEASESPSALKRPFVPSQDVCSSSAEPREQPEKQANSPVWTSITRAVHCAAQKSTLVETRMDDDSKSLFTWSPDGPLADAIGSADFSKYYQLKQASAAGTPQIVPAYARHWHRDDWRRARPITVQDCRCTVRGPCTAQTLLRQYGY